MKNTILFVAANPSDTDRLALDRDMHSIQRALSYSSNRTDFALEARWAVRPLDLLREMRRLRPTIVHFSGHGSGGVTGDHWSSGGSRDVWSGAPDLNEERGILLEGPEGRALSSTHVLAETFGAVGSSVRLVVLNSCYTNKQAYALTEYVDCVVGVPSSVPDIAAQEFAIGLYSALGDQESIAAAYMQARAAISLHGLRGDDPQLRVRPGLAATEIFLGRPSPTPAA